jgi:hypothetical protein
MLQLKFSPRVLNRYPASNKALNPDAQKRAPVSLFVRRLNNDLQRELQRLQHNTVSA